MTKRQENQHNRTVQRMARKIYQALHEVPPELLEEVSDRWQEMEKEHRRDQLRRERIPVPLKRVRC